MEKATLEKTKTQRCMMKKIMIRKSYYNIIAQYYNKRVYNSKYETYRFEQITKAILSFLPRKSNLYIHDVGSGTGDFTIPYIKKILPNSTIMASDFSEEMISINKQNHPQNDHSVQDIQDLDFKNNTFDVTICRQVLEHIPNPQKALSELYRTTKPNGAVIISTPSYFGLIAPFYFIKKASKTMQPIDNWFTPMKLNRMLKNVGFKDIYFTSAFLIPFHDILPKGLLTSVKSLDRLISKSKFLRYFGRTIILRARKRSIIFSKHFIIKKMSF